MKIEMGKKYKTRDGRDVRIYAVDGFGVHCVHGAYFDTADYGEVGWIDDSWTINGEVVEGQEGFDLELVEVKEDWEIAVDILANEASILIFNKSINYFSIVQSVSELYMTYGVSQEILVLTDPFKKWTMKKEDFRLATKEEVIEYFFGGKDEN